MDKEGYLIYGHVEFWPDDNLLISRTHGIESKMFSTASRCLHHLIQHQGELVLQDAMFIAGWGEEEAAEVKPNTLYQNIMEIRRKLRIVGLEQPFIETIPRKGWRIYSDVPLESLISTESQTTPAVDTFLPSVNVNVGGSDNKGTVDDINRFNKVHPGYIMAVIALILTIGNSLLYFNFEGQGNDYFVAYDKVESGGECQLLIDTPLFSKNSYLNYKKYYMPRCASGRKVFLTYNEERVSVISCSETLDGERNCITDLYILRR